MRVLKDQLSCKAVISSEKGKVANVMASLKLIEDENGFVTGTGAIKTDDYSAIFDYIGNPATLKFDTGLEIKIIVVQGEGLNATFETTGPVKSAGF